MSVKGLKLAIPNNLDVSDLACFKVLWPNDPYWRSVLAGLIYMVTRGRTWDERTGSVIGAQAAGSVLFNANVPLTLCDGVAPASDDANEMPVFGGWRGDWWLDTGDGCEMNGPCLPLKIEAGNLYFWDCCEWKLVGPVGGEDTTLDPGDELTFPEYEDPSTGSACGAAAAILDTIFDVASSISNHLNPVTMVKGVRGDNEGLTLDAGFLWDAYLQYLSIIVLDGIDPFDPAGGDVLWDSEAIFDETRAQRTLCRYVNVFVDEYIRPEKRQVKALWEIMRGSYPLFVVTFFQSVTLAIGFDQLRDIGLRGSQATGSDCGCPADEVTYPGFQLVTMDWDFAYFSPNTTENHDVSLSGGTPLAQDWVAAIYDWNGVCDGNGTVKCADSGGLPLVGNFQAPQSGQFARYVGTQGEGFLNAFYAGITKASVVSGTEYADSIITLQTSGNNTNNASSGVLTLVYYVGP